MTHAKTRWFAAAFLALILHAGSSRAQTAVGDWHGDLAAGGMSLRIGLTIAAGPDGALTGSLLSPDQTPQPIPIEAIKLGGAKLSFTSDAVAGRYDATWDAKTQGWTGTWSQGGNSLPLALAKGKVGS